MALTLDEAIKHCEEKAQELRQKAITDYENNETTLAEFADCRECASEHAQLAAWLKDYKQLLNRVYVYGRRSGKRQAILDYLRPKGEWIVNTAQIKCSVCNHGFFDNDENMMDYNPITDFHFNFCPNCGADMRGAENGNRS